MKTTIAQRIAKKFTSAAQTSDLESACDRRADVITVKGGATVYTFADNSSVTVTANGWLVKA